MIGMQQWHLQQVSNAPAELMRRGARQHQQSSNHGGAYSDVVDYGQDAHALRAPLATSTHHSCMSAHAQWHVHACQLCACGEISLHGA